MILSRVYFGTSGIFALVAQVSNVLSHRFPIGRPSGSRRSWGLLPVLALFCALTEGLAQTPSIIKVRPLALRPGDTNELTLSGQNLSGPTELWTAFPALELAPHLDQDRAFGTQLVYRIDVPKNAPVGVGAFRLATTNGITPFRLFMLDDLSTMQESATNKTLTGAQLMKWPIAVDGQSDEITFDYFKFEAKRGDWVSVEVVAQRLGSRLDPVLRLLDRNGRELAYCDDDPRVGRDSRLRHRIPATGTYLVEVRDINYGGGSAFHYRLRVGDFPLTSMPFPPFQQPGTNASLKILSRHEKSLPDVKTQIPSGTTRVPVPVRARPNAGSSYVWLSAADHLQTVEREPNDTTNAATAIKIPCGVSARFEQSNDVDIFRFTVEKDQKLVFRARNRSIGSPCDLFMSIQDAKGATVAEYDPTGPDEGTVTNSFKAQGEYFLVIEELNQNGGPDLGYHVDVRELLSGFALSVDACEFQSRNGDTITAKLTAVRHNYDGAIKLSVDSPFHLTTEPATIAEKKNEGELKIKLPRDLKPGTCVNLRIAGKAKVGDHEETAIASTAPALRKLWPDLRYPPPELDGLVAIGVKAAAPIAEGKPKSSDKE